MYFKENQMGENPHDKTDPRVSTAILTEHTRDGVELARKHRLPEPIIDMIRQHHGDTPVMYFYAKAVKMLGEENVDIRDFRYDGPKPQTAEAAILMLSDTVEAAVRSMSEPTPGEDFRADSQTGARQDGGRPAGRMHADLPRYRQNLFGV